MKKIVVDTSVIVKWFSKDKENLLKQADKILSDLQNNNIEIFVPELTKYELGNVLLKGKGLSPKQIKPILNQLAEIPLNYVRESTELAQATYFLAHKYKMTYYDAAFLALAKQRQAVLITENVKHQGKAKTIKVLSLADY